MSLNFSQFFQQLCTFFRPKRMFSVHFFYFPRQFFNISCQFIVSKNKNKMSMLNTSNLTSLRVVISLLNVVLFQYFHFA
jgi:hypothetical protein